MRWIFQNYQLLTRHYTPVELLLSQPSRSEIYSKVKRQRRANLKKHIKTVDIYL